MASKFYYWEKDKEKEKTGEKERERERGGKKVLITFCQKHYLKYSRRHTKWQDLQTLWFRREKKWSL